MSKSESYSIRKMTPVDLGLALFWTVEEGWNTGLLDCDTFSKQDPDGLLMGFLGEKPVSAISAARFGNDFGFIGPFIVLPEYRGKGYGKKLWDAAVDHLAGRTIGLDADTAVVEMYKSNGFVPAFEKKRYEFTGPASSPRNKNIFSAERIEFDVLDAFDWTHFGTERPVFLQAWIHQNGACPLVYVENGFIRGFGSLRPCAHSFKVGPLFAENPEIASALFLTLASFATGKPVQIDTPVPNINVQELVGSLGMKQVYETVRMYKGPAPYLMLDEIYGFTCPEMG